MKIVSRNLFFFLYDCAKSFADKTAAEKLNQIPVSLYVKYEKEFYETLH